MENVDVVVEPHKNTLPDEFVPLKYAMLSDQSYVLLAGGFVIAARK